MKIYTKTGDEGKTSLYGGERVSKSNEFIHATGTLDECNSLVGVCVALLRKEQKRHDFPEFTTLIGQLESVQGQLFCIGAHTSTPRGRSPEAKQRRTEISIEPTQELELWIDQWEEYLQPLRNFILPGGHWVAAMLHHARCGCRHAERHLCPLLEEKWIDPAAFEYVNRLSDYLFVVARIVNHLLGVHETPWITEKGAN